MIPADRSAEANPVTAHAFLHRSTHSGRSMKHECSPDEPGFIRKPFRVRPFSRGQKKQSRILDASRCDYESACFDAVNDAL